MTTGHSSYIPSNVYILDLPTTSGGTCPAGQVQMSSNALLESTDTFSFPSGKTYYLYAMNDVVSGNDLCFSGYLIDESILQSGQNSTSCSAPGVLYCSTSHSASPVRFLGTFNAPQTNAGWWAASWVNRFNSGSVNANQIINPLALTTYTETISVLGYTNNLHYIDWTAGTVYLAALSGDTTFAFYRSFRREKYHTLFNSERTWILFSYLAYH